MPFDTASGSAAGKIGLVHMDKKGRTVVPEAESRPEQDRQKSGQEKARPPSGGHPFQFAGEQQEESACGGDHACVETFGQKGKRKAQPASIEPARMVADLQHGEHGECEQQQVQPVRVAGTGQMRFERKIVGGEKGHGEKGRGLPVTSGEQPGEDGGQKTGKGGEEPEPDCRIAEQKITGCDAQKGERWLDIPVVGLSHKRIDQIVSLLYHLVGGDAVARLIPGINGLDAQTAEA